MPRVLALLAVLFVAAPATASLDYLVATSVTLSVVDETAAVFQAGTSQASVTVGANATSVDVTMTTEHVPGLGAVSAATGSCSGCTPANLEADDDVYAVVSSCCGVTQLAALQAYTDAPPAPWDDAGGPIVVTYRGLASAAISQTLQVYNWTILAWQNVHTATFATETTLSGSNGNGSHWAAADGHVRVRVTGASQAVAYSISGDWLEVRYATSNATATWAAVVDLQAAASESLDLVVTGGSVALTNGARLATVDVLLGATDTRILRIENGVVTESGLASVNVAPGALAALDMVVTATHGTVSTWDFLLVLAQGGVEVRYPVSWTLEAT